VITFAKQKFYVTTPIYYLNSYPHIGHAYTTIAADILARWKKSRGYDVFFLTGSDEHGLKLQRAAEERGWPTKKFMDYMANHFKQLWKELNIEYDKFIRTTSKDHKERVQKLIEKLKQTREIYKNTYEGLYCVGCEAYLTEKELEAGLCPYHQKKPEYMKEESYFFKLSKYQDKLLKLYKDKPDFIQPKARKNEIINRVKEGLNDLSITRTSFSWGIPFPGNDKHVLYVWFDALPNYITALGWPGEKFKKYWPADVHLMSKEINWFHSVIWPAQLTAAGIKPPKKVFIHGWLTIDGKKMSKTIGNVLNPSDIAAKYTADSLRYAIMREIPFGTDGDFSEKKLAERHNRELANDLGNLLSRALTLIEKNCNGKIPSPDKLQMPEKDLIADCNRAIDRSDEKMELLEYHHALDEIWKLVNAANRYVDQMKPWTLKGKRLDTVLYQLADSLRVICALVYPFIPSTAEELAKQLGIKVPNQKSLKPHQLKAGTKIKKGKPLFPKVEYKEEEKIVYQGDFSMLDIRVGKVVESEPIKEAKKLLKLKVDLGKLGERQLVAGLKEHYSHEKLKGKLIAVLVNLKPAKLRGNLSQGMLLAAQDDRGVVEVLDLKKSKPGDKITVDGLELPPKKEITYEEFSTVRLVVEKRYATWSGKPLKTKYEQIKLTKAKDKARIL